MWLLYLVVMQTLPLSFHLSDGQIFTGYLARMDTGTTTPKHFHIKQHIDGKLYHAGELIRYTNKEGESFWQASGDLSEFSEALGMLVEGVEWGW